MSKKRSSELISLNNEKSNNESNDDMEYILNYSENNSESDVHINKKIKNDSFSNHNTNQIILPEEQIKIFITQLFNLDNTAKKIISVQEQYTKNLVDLKNQFDKFAKSTNESLDKLKYHNKNASNSSNSSNSSNNIREQNKPHELWMDYIN